MVERFAALGLIEPVKLMLRSRDIGRISQIQRLRHLGLNLAGQQWFWTWSRNCAAQVHS